MQVVTIAYLLAMLYLAEPVVGEATHYDPSLHGEIMRGGGVYDRADPTIAASGLIRGDPAIPLGTWLKVCNQDRVCIEVQVVDTGSFPPHDLDLSEAAFVKLAPLSRGRIPIIWRVR